jgi:hypothetical protein
MLLAEAAHRTAKERRSFEKLRDQLVGTDPSPIDVLRCTMIWYLQNNRFEEAGKVAKDLAPFVHAKPVSLEGEGRPIPLHLDSLTDQQLDKIISRLQEGIARGIVDGTMGVVRENEDEPKLQ